MKEASTQNAKWCIIIGDEELKKKEITIKDMATGKQRTVKEEEFFKSL